MEQNLKLYKEWFEEIAEKASRLTTGNVSHLGATIRGLALNCTEYIESLEQELVPKIKGWVARDGVEDAFNGCGLILHYSKPWRAGGEWSNCTIAMHLPWNMFQDLKWVDEPIEVELTIRKV